MRLYPSKLRMTLIFLFNTLLIVGIFLAITYRLFFMMEWNFLQWLLIALLIVIAIGSYIFIIKTYYYTIQAKFISVRKFNKEYWYQFGDIIYIDKEYSEKKSSILFVTNKGHVRYLMHDKDRKVYQAMLKSCKNLVSKQEVCRRFPKLTKELK